jgi:hypothetical protein
MECKITNFELNNLINLIQKTGIPQDWIFKVCNISCLIDLTMIQYNYLLLLIKRTELCEVK